MNSGASAASRGCPAPDGVNIPAVKTGPEDGYCKRTGLPDPWIAR